MGKSSSSYVISGHEDLEYCKWFFTHYRRERRQRTSKINEEPDFMEVLTNVDLGDRVLAAHKDSLAEGNSLAPLMIFVEAAAEKEKCKTTVFTHAWCGAVSFLSFNMLYLIIGVK